MENPWFLFIGSILFFLGLRFISTKSKYQLHSKISNIFLVIHLTLTFVFILSFIFEFKGVSFRGFRSTSWIFLAMTFFGFLFFILKPHTLQMKTVLVLPYLWTILCIGFSALLICYVMIDYRNDLVYSERNYRLERTGWFITPCQLPSLIVMKGIFEERFDLDYSNPICLNKQSITSVKISPEGKDSVKVVIYHTTDTAYLANPIVKYVNIK